MLSWGTVQARFRPAAAQLRISASTRGAVSGRAPLWPARAVNSPNAEFVWTVQVAERTLSFAVPE